MVEPTNAELSILEILWEHGPSSVRFVHDTLTREKKTVQYTSVLKQMQLMAEKGLLKRDESQMKHIYHPTQKEGNVKSKLLKKFVDNHYEGSSAKLILQLLGSKKSSKKEIAQIKEMLSKLEDK